MRIPTTNRSQAFNRWHYVQARFPRFRDHLQE
jgi:hypothetical protein